jgi:hypothetical protein
MVGMGVRLGMRGFVIGRGDFVIFVWGCFDCSALLGRPPQLAALQRIPCSFFPHAFWSCHIQHMFKIYCF